MLENTFRCPGGAASGGERRSHRQGRITSRRPLLVGLATIWLGLVACVPVAGASTVAGTLFQADFTGSMTIETIQSGPMGPWTADATVSLNATTNPSHNPAGARNPAQTDIWVPRGASPPFSGVGGAYYPDGSAIPADSSLVESGNLNGGQGSCPATGVGRISDQLAPELGVHAAAGRASVVIEYLGQLFPAAVNGNANSIDGCTPGTQGYFQVTTPLNFGNPWVSGADMIEFGFNPISGTAASQALSGNNLSMLATQAGASDSGMMCNNDTTATPAQSRSRTRRCR